MPTCKVVHESDCASRDSREGRSARRSVLCDVARYVLLRAAIGLLSLTAPCAFFISINVQMPFGLSQTKHYETGPEERRAVTLQDGTLLQLNVKSLSTIQFDNATRRVRVPRGEASFRVSRDPRPFQAFTPHAMVRAEPGALFSLLIGAQSTEIHVRDAPVIVEVAQTWRAKPPFVIGLGKRVEVHRGKVTVNHNGEIILGQNALPVLEGGQSDERLQLRGTRLADAVAEINALHERQLRVDDPDLLDERINGLLNPYDRTALIDYMLQRGALLERLPDGTERLTEGCAKPRTR